MSVATSGDIRDQPKVADAASELLQDVFGRDKSPCRLVYGVASLPLGDPVELEGRFDYAAIGTISNVASRLCDEAKPGQILISPRVLTKVENAVQVEPVGEFALKGIRRPLAGTMWSLLHRLEFESG